MCTESGSFVNVYCLRVISFLVEKLLQKQSLGTAKALLLQNYRIAINNEYGWATSNSLFTGRLPQMASTMDTLSQQG